MSANKESINNDYNDYNDYHNYGTNTDRKCNDAKVNEIQNKVDEIKLAMVDNLGKVIERGEKIDDLGEKALALENTARIFNNGAKKVKRRMCMDNFKILVCYGLIAAVVILCLVLLIYFSVKK
jgi:hypothetical protein